MCAHHTHTHLVGFSLLGARCFFFNDQMDDMENTDIQQFIHIEIAIEWMNEWIHEWMKKKEIRRKKMYTIRINQFQSIDWSAFSVIMTKIFIFIIWKYFFVALSSCCETNGSFFSFASLCRSFADWWPFDHCTRAMLLIEEIICCGCSAKSDIILEFQRIFSCFFFVFPAEKFKTLTT